MYGPHSCISRTLTFAYIFLKKNNFTFSRKGKKNLFGKKGAAYRRASTINNQGFLRSGVLSIRGLTIRDSYDQGFLQSGVLTIRGSYNQGSYNQGFLRSGVQINVSYITSLCPDVDNDRKILQSEVCVDRKFSHPVRILCSDVEIDFTRSYSY